VKARGEGQKGAEREGGGARRGTASRDAPLCEEGAPTLRGGGRRGVTGGLSGQGRFSQGRAPPGRGGGARHARDRQWGGGAGGYGRAVRRRLSVPTSLLRGSGGGGTEFPVPGAGPSQTGGGAGTGAAGGEEKNLAPRRDAIERGERGVLRADDCPLGGEIAVGGPGANARRSGSCRGPTCRNGSPLTGRAMWGRRTALFRRGGRGRGRRQGRSWKGVTPSLLTSRE
jgi:hypothetical protein